MSPNNRSLSLSQLSESEEYRFGVAFAVALAEATGVGMVVLDRGDILLPAERSLLTATLLESNLDQIFLLAAGEPMDEWPEIPGCTWFELQNIDGTTTIRAQHQCAGSDLSYAAE